ncbi:MAG: aldehyde dehydrogenase [Nostocaceae cyanobacterium]|nr:aldehyde dehydrogenase [Nostocaceae cyanobacterium]
MIQLSIADIISNQRTFFQSGKTKDVDFRLNQLKILKQAVLENKQEIVKALNSDLKKPEFEAYATEIGVVKEIDDAIKNIKRWSKPKTVSLPLEQVPGKARIYPEPLGVVLIIAPWNYPFQLAIAPLVAAIAAGNCAIIKPSEISEHTSRTIAEIIGKYFDPAYITVVEGGVETSQQLLAEKFDHIFFTGGTGIGKIIMAAAAKHLTPVTLELGGKSPCIVDADINLETTAKRIIWGKFINAGQTCIAPDYLLVHKDIKKDLLAALKKTVQEFYGEHPTTSSEYARIISQKHFYRLVKFLSDGDIIIGGESNADECYIAPTILDNVSLEAPVMQEEIFGPILPVIEYTDISEALTIINNKSKPLALYLFTNNQNLQERVLQSTSSGGVCINETIMHVGVSALPFGGVGDSGMGSYHGKAGFDTFSHYKSVLKKPFWFDLDWRYPPYNQGKFALLKRIIG